MAITQVDYIPLQFIAGSSEIRTARVTIPGGQADIPALTPMKLDANYKAIPATALTDKIIGVLVPGAASNDVALEGTTSKASDQFWHIYISADLFGDMVDFTAMPTANSELKKASIFFGTGINLIFPAAGQV